MLDSIDKKLEEIRCYYDSLSDEEFKSRLEKAGFTIIEDIPGKVFFCEPEPDFTIVAKEVYYLSDQKEPKFRVDDLPGVA